MKGIKEILGGVTAADLAEGYSVNYFLWHLRAPYAIHIERYDGSRVDAALYCWGQNTMPNRHIYADFGALVGAIAEIEQDIFQDRKINFCMKPLTLWKRLEDRFSGPYAEGVGGRR